MNYWENISPGIGAKIIELLFHRIFIELSVFKNCELLFLLLLDSDSPAMSTCGQVTTDTEAPDNLPNEISAPYEIPQFPIEQIEKKLLLQRHLNAK